MTATAQDSTLADGAVVDPEAWEEHLLALASTVRADRIEIVASSLLECVLWILEDHERDAHVPEPASPAMRAALWSDDRAKWEAAHRLAAPALQSLVETPALPEQPSRVARLLASRAVLEAFLAAPLPPDGEPVADVSVLGDAFADVADLTELATDHMILPRSPTENAPGDEDLDHHPVTIAHRRVQEGLFKIASAPGIDAAEARDHAAEAARRWAGSLRARFER